MCVLKGCNNNAIQPERNSGEAEITRLIKRYCSTCPDFGISGAISRYSLFMKSDADRRVVFLTLLGELLHRINSQLINKFVWFQLRGKSWRADVIVYHKLIR